MHGKTSKDKIEKGIKRGRQREKENKDLLEHDQRIKLLGSEMEFAFFHKRKQLCKIKAGK